MNSAVSGGQFYKSFSEAGKRLQKRTLDKIPQIFGVQKPEDIFALVGEGRMRPEVVLEKLYPDLAKSKRRSKSSDNNRPYLANQREPMLMIQGINPGVAITMARCCHPLPGENIIGIFTTGKGVTVHRADCANLVDFSDMPELWMDVGWEQEGPKRVMGRLNAVLSNEPGALAAVATIIGQHGGNISNIHLNDRNADFLVSSLIWRSRTLNICVQLLQPFKQIIL